MTRVVLRLCELLPALAIAAVATPALAQDRGVATLRACNKGAASINVVVAYDVEVGLFGRALDVSGWFFLAPGQCRVVVETQGFLGCDGQSTLPIYLGFARFDSPHAGAAAQVDAVPDFGTWQHNLVQALMSGTGAGPVLSRAHTTLCVRRGAFGYRVADSSVSCASLGTDAADPYFPLAAAFRFEPVSSCFVSLYVGQGQWAGGDYYLDIAPQPNDLALHASAGSAHSGAANTAGAESDSGDVLTQLAIAAAEEKARAEEQKRAKEAARLEANRKAIEARKTDPSWIRHENEQRGKWGAPPAPASSYTAAWLGKQMHVRGTVADVSVEYGGSPSWLTMRFRDSQFVVCSPSPSIFTGLFGDDLNALVGQEIDVIGQVESPWCSGGAGSIRVLDSDSVRMLEAH